jgi:hypothetical protein
MLRTPERAAPSRRHTQARAAPFTSRADHQEPARSAPARVGQFRRQGWHPRRTASAKDAMSPAPAAPSPPSPRASTQRPSAAVRASREPVQTSQPLAGVRLPRPAPSDAAPSPKEPRRAAGTPRRAPHLSRAARTTRNRRGARMSARIGQFRRQGWHPRRRAPQGLPRAHRAPRKPRPARPSQAQASRETALQHARRGSKCTHSQPLAGVCAHPALRRPTPRRVRRRRAEPQAHPDARRTFREPCRPPGTDEERARGVLHSFECHVTAGTRHSWHPLIAHTQTCRPCNEPPVQSIA